ncbi:MAG: MarR family winged helix-turn-helix transcriptional regulator [Nitrososphaeraceae archaeon]
MKKFDFENNIGFLINRTAKALTRSFDQELRQNVGISFGQWKVIAMLVNYNNGLSQKEIAEKLRLEGPTLIPIIDKLEKDGLVVRQTDPNDRRNNRLFLTHKVENMWERMIECGSKIKKSSLKGIPPEHISITKDTIEKMYQNIQDVFTPCYLNSEPLQKNIHKDLKNKIVNE